MRATLLVPFAPLALLSAACSSGALPSGAARSDAGAGADAGSEAGGLAGADAAAPAVFPPFMPSASILVSGHDRLAQLCRTEICRHNENTDMIAWNGAIWLVHRTAYSQTLGPNSALHVYRSTDKGATFAETALIPAPATRDIRDPCFYVVGSTLHIKALTRLPVVSVRDSDVETVAVNIHSTDGVHWTDPVPMGPSGWSFWRIKESAGTYYTAAYQDGDAWVVLFTSTEGLTWSEGASIYPVSFDTPLETELTFMPSGRMLALVRMDGSSDAYLLGDEGPLRTKVCWSMPPYGSFSCPQEIVGQRLDGPLTFFQNGRLFVIARSHLQGTGRKRTTLFELTGTLEGGPIGVSPLGDLPSAGDTSYAGIAFTDPQHAIVSWYSGDLAQDEAWVTAMFDLTDIWVGSIDFARL